MNPIKGRTKDERHQRRYNAEFQAGKHQHRAGDTFSVPDEEGGRKTYEVIEVKADGTIETQEVKDNG